MLSTIIVSGILIILIYFAVRHLIRNAKSGKCDGCSGCGSYGKEEGCNYCKDGNHKKN